MSRRRGPVLRLMVAGLMLSVLGLAGRSAAQSITLRDLPGVGIDDGAAEKRGDWKKSVHTRPYVEEGYIHATGGDQSVRFSLSAPATGQYHVLFAYTAGTNRPRSVPVRLEAADGPHQVDINQQQPPVGLYTFHDLGEFSLAAGKPLLVEISTSGVRGTVIADAVLLLTAEQLAQAKQQAKSKPLVALARQKKPAPQPAAAKKSETSEGANPEQDPPQLAFERQLPSRAVARLTPQALDALLAEHAGSATSENLIDDEQFLRRVSLDLIGRQPTVEEQRTFLVDESPDRRHALVNRLLALPEYGVNWANYWCDTISARQQEPQLTFHNYAPFKEWLAGELNRHGRWDEIVYRTLTATGKVGDDPATTFIAFHQGDNKRVAGETSRVFLGVQIACAECHDHPFLDMPQEVFHGMAAYFVRLNAKIAQKDSNHIELVRLDKGEHKIPGQSDTIAPTPLVGDALEMGTSDAVRRQALARWITSGDNPYFAKAYVNRIWARLMGRGFCEPVDEIGEGADARLPELHAAVADHFIASGYDTKELVRLIAGSKAYQQALDETDGGERPLFSAAVPKKLRGDEVFDSLVTAIGLPNIDTPTVLYGQSRFPPPPKSTRDLVQDAFGFDPSFKDELLTRTMKQAMFMMNNDQLQEQIDAAPESDTMLAKLLAVEPDNKKLAVRLYEAVLARQPTPRELEIIESHVGNVQDRGQAFEDLLWSLINSAEFTTKR